jgi:hypothetical protein
VKSSLLTVSWLWPLRVLCCFVRGWSLSRLPNLREKAEDPGSTKAWQVSESGDGELQIEVARRGADTHQEARTASPAHLLASKEKLNAGS